MRCTPLDAPFGALLHLESEASLEEEEQVYLRRAFAEHGLLVVRTGPLTDARQIEILSPLGRIEPDDSGAPMRMEVTNQHDASTAPEGELVFHYDYAYDPTPIPGISMYGAVVEGTVTPTCFANSASVLERLPPALVARLRTLEASHACFRRHRDDPKLRTREPNPLIPRGEPGWGPDHYWAHHPAVFENAFGAETLFLCLQHTDRLIGLPRDESDAILEEIYAALYAPEQIYIHEWQPCDLVVWDNLTIQHARPQPLDAPRSLRRYHLSPTDLTADYLRVAREQGIM